MAARVSMQRENAMCGVLNAEEMIIPVARKPPVQIFLCVGKLVHHRISFIRIPGDDLEIRRCGKGKAELGRFVFHRVGSESCTGERKHQGNAEKKGREEPFLHMGHRLSL